MGITKTLSSEARPRRSRRQHPGFLLVDALTTSQERELPIRMDDNVMGGTPVVAGTRIPVYVLLELLAENYSVTRIVTEVYPTLRSEQVADTLSFVADLFTPSRPILQPLLDQPTRALSDLPGLSLTPARKLLLSLAKLFDF
jgi:uncharacterized protein (DUF433 family)